jgi:hypothetical protein
MTRRSTKKSPKKTLVISGRSRPTINEFWVLDQLSDPAKHAAALNNVVEAAIRGGAEAHDLEVLLRSLEEAPKLVSENALGLRRNAALQELNAKAEDLLKITLPLAEKRIRGEKNIRDVNLRPTKMILRGKAVTKTPIADDLLDRVDRLENELLPKARNAADLNRKIARRLNLSADNAGLRRVRTLRDKAAKRRKAHS